MRQEEPAISIRKARIGDGRDILECLKEAFAAFRDSYTPDAFVDTVLAPKSLGHRMATMCVFVAVNDAGEVIGTVACNVVNQGEGHIRGMAVRPAWHGRGVATLLLASVEAELRKCRCSRITLDTTAPLQRATLFYEKHGFTRSGRVADFFGMELFEYVKILRT
jgi:N-acetylglutamate synthase-like GNAT family acetyltransferase